MQRKCGVTPPASRSAQQLAVMSDETWSMEELTLSSDEHGTPDEEMECMATMEDITVEDGNYCEYKTAPSGTWHKSKYAADTVRRLISTQFPDYVSGVRKADCAADLKRRLAKGPPIYIEDKHALPIPEGDTHIERIWFAAEAKEYSAKLKGCVEGAERDTLWKELAAFTPVDGWAKDGEEEAPADDEK